MSKQLSDEAIALIKQFGLSSNPDDGDVFFDRRFKIITRQGIDKIMAKAKVDQEDVTFVYVDPFDIVLKGTFSLSDKKITTTASASIDRIEFVKVVKTLTDENGNTRTKEEVVEALIKKGNVQQKPSYLTEMAEKRLNSRGVLKLTGFYDLGFYGQDESDDFSDAVRNHWKDKSSTKEKVASVKSSKV